AEDGIRDPLVTGVQTCALPIFSPANVMRLLEVVRGAKSSKETIATVAELARRIRKVWVLAGNCDGFIGNRMLAGYLREAAFLVEIGRASCRKERRARCWSEL